MLAGALFPRAKVKRERGNEWMGVLKGRMDGGRVYSSTARGKVVVGPETG